MLTKAFTAYTKILRRYVGFYNTYSLVSLGQFIKHQTDTSDNCTLTLDRYLRIIAYGLQKTSPSYRLIVQLLV